MIRQIIVNVILQAYIVGQTFSQEMQLGALRLQILISPVIDVEVATHFLWMLLTKTKI